MKASYEIEGQELFRREEGAEVRAEQLEHSGRPLLFFLPSHKHTRPHFCSHTRPHTCLTCVLTFVLTHILTCVLVPIPRLLRDDIKASLFGALTPSLDVMKLSSILMQRAEKASIGMLNIPKKTYSFYSFFPSKQ